MVGGGAGSEVPLGGEYQNQGHDEYEEEQECCQSCDNANQLYLLRGVCYLPRPLAESRGEGTVPASGTPSASPKGVVAFSPCLLPDPTHNDSQAQSHQLSQAHWIGLYESAKESGGVSSWAGSSTWQCPCTDSPSTHMLRSLTSRAVPLLYTK